jgi:hypothetical protein
MKTAMQDMLEWVRATFPMDLNTPRMIEHKIESLLEKEKEQIMNAFSRGLGTELSDWENSQQYYDRIYNQNK